MATSTAPIWCLAQGGRPTRIEDWKGTRAPDYECREGDTAWTAVSTKRFQELAERLGKRTKD